MCRNQIIQANLWVGLLALALVPFFALSQTDRSADTEPEVAEATDVEVVPANYNNTRSNRSSVAAPVDTNICDVVTCPDGSCAASTDECAIAATTNNNEAISDSIGHAAAGDQIGEILKTHTCPIHGYHLIIARPAGYSTGASERVIQVEKTNRFFNATWNEVSSLVDNYPPHEIEYNELAQNPGPAGERYCNRDGYKIPTDMSVYQVSLAHYSDYTGQTSIFADNNLELAPLISVIQAYNQHRVFGDELPPTCNYGCLDDSSGVMPDDNSFEDMNFGEIDFGTSDPRDPSNNINEGVNPSAGGSDGPESSTETIYQSGPASNVSGDSNNSIGGSVNGNRVPADYYPDADADGFGEPDNRAQSHNSSRSNRTEGMAADGVDPDVDVDQSEVEWRAGRFVTEGSAADNGSDWVVSWGRAVDSTGTNHSWGRGVAVLPQVNSDAAVNARDRISALQVSGEAVRAWSEEERISWQEYQATEQPEFPELQLLAHVIEQTQLNERILEMRVGDDEPSDDVVLNHQPIQVRYQTELRLFGFIPLERELDASLSSDGVVTVEYPWYRFLSTTPEHSQIEQLLQDTRDLLVGSM